LGWGCVFYLWKYSTAHLFILFYSIILIFSLFYLGMSRFLGGNSEAGVIGGLGEVMEGFIVMAVRIYGVI
jgi:hypothetical protein